MLRESIHSVPDFCTVKAVFSECFEMAEQTFGPREPQWEYTVLLREGLPPETVNDGHSQVCVYLSTGRSLIGYFFEAAHEAIHCLSPNVPSGRATYLEEAIAAEFSLKVVQHKFGQEIGLELQNYISADYHKAMSLSAEIGIDTIRIGQQVRERHGSFSMGITPESLHEMYPHAPSSVRHGLLEGFPRQKSEPKSPAGGPKKLRQEQL